MKCVRIKETGEIFRVNNQLADFLVNKDKASYVAKAVWKATDKLYLNENAQIIKKGDQVYVDNK